MPAFPFIGFCYFYLLILESGVNSQPRKLYEGAYLGKLNTYAHQTTGEVYVIDEYTILIKNFFFDGLAQDAFFWTGATSRPSNVGFIIPNEMGRTNTLKRYINADITLKIPDDKKISSLKWIAVWDIRDNANFADIYIPEGFEPPSPKRINEFTRNSHGVSSGTVTVLSSRSIRISDFSFDGNSNSAFFWVGTGPQPHASGKKIPDELGYLEPLGRYDKETITLEMPGEMTIFDADWISVWDEELQENYGSINLPEGLNIPPSLAVIKKRDSRLPNCEQLHKRLTVSWELFGPQITFEISAQIRADDYIAFGLSGSPNASRMLGSDVSVSYIHNHLGVTTDYNITDMFPCINVNGFYRGICPDTKLGGVDNFQILTYFRDEDITRITFRRNLLNVGDEGDLIYSKEEPSFVVWALGRMNRLREPRMHNFYPRKDVKIHFGRKPEKNCLPFIHDPELDSPSDFAEHGHLPTVRDKPWGPLKIINQSLTTFYARLGVPGGDRGYTRSTDEQSSPSLVWYINGLLAPVLFVKRGVTYQFRVEGGNIPSKANTYHPLYITNDPQGGFVQYSEEERKKWQVYAGIDFDRKGRPSPMNAGKLCSWTYSPKVDPRRSDSRFVTFLNFRNTLNYSCESGSPSILVWTPNASTPDLVYYQSYTQRNMGWRIVVLDDFSSPTLSQSTSTNGGYFIPVPHPLIPSLISFMVTSCFIFITHSFNL